jgi:hypothetical protein
MATFFFRLFVSSFLLTKGIFAQEVPQKIDTHPFHLHKGVQHLVVQTDDFLDVIQTFTPFKHTLEVKIYDKKTDVWAVYPFAKYHKEVELHFIQPHKIFTVNATQAITITPIYHTMKKGRCSQLRSEMKSLLDLGDDNHFTFSKQHDIGVRSSYLSHHQKGIYGDNRITLLYTPQKIQSKPTYRYGSAIPKVAFLFSKHYEGKIFYIYSYYDDGCYKGIFPSEKIPPFPFLKKID